MRLIIIDGLDGSGKDTHAKLIMKRYLQRGDRVIIRSHPKADNIFGTLGKKALQKKGRINRINATVFYALDVIRSVIKYYGNQKYDTLIITRYLLGTAYLPEILAKPTYKFLKRIVPTSDYMFYLDAPPTELLKRIKKRKDRREMFESHERLVKTRQMMLKIIDDSWHKIKSTRSKEDTQREILKILNKLDKRQE